MDDLKLELLANKHAKPQYKYPYLFLALYIAFILTTTILANRFVMLGPILEPGGIFVFPMTFSICDIVGEVYGYTYPRLFIWLGAMSQAIFVFVGFMVAYMPYPVFFKYSLDYQIVFIPTVRYFFSGMTALLVGEFINVYILTKLKVKFRGRVFIMRSFFSAAIGQACLTIIVDLLNYTGKLPVLDLLWMMLCGYGTKMIWAILFLFPAWLIVKKLKKIEHVDHYDINTNFNPFIFGLK